MGQRVAIGNSSYQCNGSITGYWQRLLKNNWAQAMPWAAAAANVAGPFQCACSTCRNIIGPKRCRRQLLLPIQRENPNPLEAHPRNNNGLKRIYWQQQLKMQQAQPRVLAAPAEKSNWAQAVPLAAGATNAMGPL